MLAYDFSPGPGEKTNRLTMTQQRTPEREVGLRLPLDRWLLPVGVVRLQERVEQWFQRLLEGMALVLERLLVERQDWQPEPHSQAAEQVDLMLGRHWPGERYWWRKGR